MVSAFAFPDGISAAVQRQTPTSESRKTGSQPGDIQGIDLTRSPGAAGSHSPSVMDRMGPALSGHGDSGRRTGPWSWPGASQSGRMRPTMEYR